MFQKDSVCIGGKTGKIPQSSLDLAKKNAAAAHCSVIVVLPSPTAYTATVASMLLFGSKVHKYFCYFGHIYGIPYNIWYSSNTASTAVFLLGKSITAEEPSLS